VASTERPFGSNDRFLQWYHYTLPLRDLKSDRGPVHVKGDGARVFSGMILSALADAGGAQVLAARRDHPQQLAVDPDARDSCFGGQGTSPNEQ
jgi:hypothetical protein